VHSVEELKMLVRESQEYGAIQAQQEEMLQKVFAFADRQVNEVMIPGPRCRASRSTETVQDLLALFAEASHARFPVYEDDLDNIVASSHQDVPAQPGARPNKDGHPLAFAGAPCSECARDRCRADLFTTMRATQNQMAVVIDEYGGTAGIVTLEELVEEIVGRLSDELVTMEESVIRWMRAS